MEFTPHVEAVRRDLAAAAQAGTAEIRDAAERLSYAVEPSLRLALLEALGIAAGEVTAQLDSAVVEVRLRGRDADLVVIDAGDTPAAPAPPTPAETDEGTSRISLRLPESLKSRVEQAAADSGLSVNAWLVRAISQTLDTPASGGPARVAGRRISGWVR
jgi:hypothetical protein